MWTYKENSFCEIPLNKLGTKEIAGGKMHPPGLPLKLANCHGQGHGQEAQ